MGMPKCTSSRYRNFFLTVPDRGFTKEELVAFIKLWLEKATSRCNFFEVVREPYTNPEKGFTHHYHAGLCFENKVGYLKFRKACNKSKLYTGMDFRTPLVAKGKSAAWIFENYFHNPSKYKPLDEEPMLVIDRPPEPPGGGKWSRLYFHGRGPLAPPMGCNDPQIWEAFKQDIRAYNLWLSWHQQYNT